MELLAFFNLLQLIGGFILAVGYVPQIIKIIKTKSVKDFSKLYLGAIFTGIVFMEAYAVYMFFWQHTAGAFFATNTVSFVLSGIEFLLVLIYSKKYGKKEKVKTA